VQELFYFFAKRHDLFRCYLIFENFIPCPQLFDLWLHSSHSIRIKKTRKKFLVYLWLGSSKSHFTGVYSCAYDQNHPKSRFIEPWASEGFFLEGAQ